MIKLSLICSLYCLWRVTKRPFVSAEARVVFSVLFHARLITERGDSDYAKHTYSFICACTTKHTKHKQQWRDGVYERDPVAGLSWRGRRVQVGAYLLLDRTRGHYPRYLPLQTPKASRDSRPRRSSRRRIRWVGTHKEGPHWTSDTTEPHL